MTYGKMRKIALGWLACTVLCVAALVLIAVYSEPVGGTIERMVGSGAAKGVWVGVMVGAITLALMASSGIFSRYRATLRSFKKEYENELDDIEVFLKRASPHLVADFGDLLKILWMGRRTREGVTPGSVSLAVGGLSQGDQVKLLWLLLQALGCGILVHKRGWFTLGPGLVRSAERGSPIDLRVVPGSSGSSGPRTSLA